MLSGTYVWNRLTLNYQVILLNVVTLKFESTFTSTLVKI